MSFKPLEPVLLQRSADQLAASFRALAIRAAVDAAAVTEILDVMDHSDPADASYAPIAVSKSIANLLNLLGPLNVALMDLEYLNNREAL